MRKLLFITVSLILAATVAAQNWTLVWEDNFDGPQIDTTVWKRIPRGGNDWNNYMSQADSLYDQRDGRMILRGVANGNLKADTARFLTGGVWTYGGKSFDPPFRIEIRAKLHGAQGAWPAIWMLPYDDKKHVYPRGGELDIMEHLSYEPIAYQTVHSYYTLMLKQSENPPHYATGDIYLSQFNTYALDITADSLTFYINGRPTFSYPRISTDLEGQYPFMIPMALLIDMQLGGGWVGQVDPADLPTMMEIDYVKYYKPAN